MKVLMLGWEFAPVKSGGLGVACRGIAEGLDREKVEVTFVIPSYLNAGDRKFGKKIRLTSKQIKMLSIKVDRQFLYSPYQGIEMKENWQQETTTLPAVNSGEVKKHNEIYGKNFWLEVERFAVEAAGIAKEHQHDVIHVHDWMTYQAGIRAKQISGKPLVAHVHATELDRTAGHPNYQIFAREKMGLQMADHVIVVSEHTKRILVKYYRIEEEKISVVHNAALTHAEERKPDHVVENKLQKKDKLVLFLGRVTVQKGPEMFVEMAAKVLSKRSENVKFVIAGHGDMMELIIHKIISLGLQDKIICAGFLSGADLEKALYHASIYVMPSVSEPFGISALEAVEFGTPVIMTKTSGAAEVIKNSLQVDHWDVEKMASQVIALLDYPVLAKTIVREARKETAFLNWHEQSKKIKKIYQKLLKND